VSLAESEQLFCDNCEKPITGKDIFCPYCGALEGSAVKARKGIVCDNHGHVQAVGRCVTCKKVVCEECAVRWRGRFFCSNDSHVEMAFDWVGVYATAAEYEAEMIAANLDSTGIPARVRVQRDQMSLATSDDLAVTKVMVPVETADEAKALIASFPLQESEDDSST
jgi:B-box zinc finger